MKHILFELLGRHILIHTNFSLTIEQKPRKVYSDPNRRYEGEIDWTETMKKDRTVYQFLNELIAVDGIEQATISPREIRVIYYAAYDRGELLASTLALIVSNYELDVDDLQIGEGNIWAEANFHPVTEYLK